MACRAVSLSNALVRELWADSSANKYTLAARAGCSYTTLQRRAAAIGLEIRKGGGRQKLDPELVRLMWLAGVSSPEIGLAVGCSYSAVVRAAAALGLPPRGMGFKPKLTLRDYQAVQLRLAMQATLAATAADPRQEWRVDSKGGRPKLQVAA